MNLLNKKLLASKFLFSIFVIILFLVYNSPAITKIGDFCKLNMDFFYDSEKIYIQTDTPLTYKIFYTSPNEVNIFFPFVEIYDNQIEHSFYKIKTFNNHYYSVIKVNTFYPIPYELISFENDEENGKIVISFPLEYKIVNTLYFYTPDNRVMAKLHYKIFLREFLKNKINIFSYNMQIQDFNLFNIRFIQNENKEDLDFIKDGFWFAINGTYFAKFNNKYSTVAAVVYDNRILSYPVEHRPPRGFWGVLKNEDGYSFLFDRLPNLRKDFENFINSLKREHNIYFLIQAGPLIHRDFSFVMDPDLEAFGTKGNNIIEPAPRTVIYIDKNNNVNFETIYGVGVKRKSGLTLYELASYLYDSKDSINLDGGSSTCMYVANKKLEPLFQKNFPFKSQNYIVFYTDKDFYTVSPRNLYYYFPGIFGIDHNNLSQDKTFGTKYVTFFDGYQKYQKVIYNDSLEYFDNKDKKMVFIQTNDIELSLEKLNLKNPKNVVKYYNCYIIQYE